MNRYRDSIYYMLLKMVNNPSDAEDLTIEAFGKAFRNLDSYTPKFAFSTWLFKIATNNCVDFIRKKQVSPTPLDHLQDSMDNVTLNIQSDLPDPEESMINHQKIAALKEIVNQLKPRYKITYRVALLSRSTLMKRSHQNSSFRLEPSRHSCSGLKLCCTIY